MIIVDYLINYTFNIPSISFINVLNQKNIFKIIIYGIVISFLNNNINILIILLFLYFLSLIIKNYLVINIIFFIIVSYFLFGYIHIISFIIYFLYIKIFNIHRIL